MKRKTTQECNSVIFSLPSVQISQASTKSCLSWSEQQERLTSKLTACSCGPRVSANWPSHSQYLLAGKWAHCSSHQAQPVTWSINTNQLDSITSQRKGPECYLPTLGDATGSALSLLLDTFRTFRLDNSPMVSGREIKELAARRSSSRWSSPPIASGITYNDIEMEIY